MRRDAVGEVSRLIRGNGRQGVLGAGGVFTGECVLRAVEERLGRLRAALGHDVNEVTPIVVEVHRAGLEDVADDLRDLPMPHGVPLLP